MTELEIWAKWESQIVNGLYPLRRFMGRSNHSVVFQTEFKGQKAAIKLLPEDPSGADAQLALWTRASGLSHPNLMRILDSGRCKLGGHPFLFVVMDYAEQTLAQILPHRALTLDETRELLKPTLAALAYLHRKHLVQAQLTPPNFLVVADQLKLASDTIRAAGDRMLPDRKSTLYDAPETRAGTIETAADVWGLGVTLVETLTQHPPAWNAERGGEVKLPPNLPDDFASALRRCLDVNAAVRPTVQGLLADFTRVTEPMAMPDPMYAEAAASPEASDSTESEPAAFGSAHPVEPVLPVEAIPTAEPVLADTPIMSTESAPPTLMERPAAMPAAPADWRLSTRWLGAATAVCLGLILVVWIVRHHRSAGNPAATPMVVQTAAKPMAAAIPPLTAAATPGAAVIHQEIPTLSRGARNSVHGEIKVSVRVTVDKSGNVVGEKLETHGPSRYFARIASDAAKKWRFVPADTAASRQYLLQFEFTRAGATAQMSTPPAS
jgi:Protein kinase domain